MLCRSEISDSISERGRQKKRQVAHHLGNAKRSFTSHSSPVSDSYSDSESQDEELSRVTPSSSHMPAAQQSNSRHQTPSGMMQLQKQQPVPNNHAVYSSEEEDGW